MDREQFFTWEMSKPRPESKEILLSEFEDIFPDLANDLIYELDLKTTTKDVVLVLHPNGTVSVKQLP